MQLKRPLVIGDIVAATREDTPGVLIDVTGSPFGDTWLCYIEELNEFRAVFQDEIQYRLGTTIGSTQQPGMRVFYRDMRQMMTIASYTRKSRPQSFNMNGQTKTRPYHTEKTYLIRDPYNESFKPREVPETSLIPVHIPAKILTRWEKTKETNSLIRDIFHRARSKK